MSQRRKVELALLVSSGILKHPENRSRTGYRWKTKTASFKKKSKHHLQAIICCLLPMQIASTTDNYFITSFNSRPKRPLSDFPQHFILQRNYRSGSQYFKNIISWLDQRVVGLQVSYFDNCEMLFCPLEIGNISTWRFTLWPFGLHMGLPKYWLAGPPGTTLEGKSDENPFCILTDITKWLLGHLMPFVVASEMCITLNYAILSATTGFSPLAYLYI